MAKKSETQRFFLDENIPVNPDGRTVEGRIELKVHPRNGLMIYRVQYYERDVGWMAAHFSSDWAYVSLADLERAGQ